jgi:hypothetical protein
MFRAVGRRQSVIRAVPSATGQKYILQASCHAARTAGKAKILHIQAAFEHFWESEKQARVDYL